MTPMIRSRRDSRIKVVAGVLLVLGTACETSAPPTNPSSVRDSSGVRIVESGRADGDDAWHVSQPPAFRIGWQPGGMLFENLQAGVILSGGSVVVGDAGSSLIHRISASGEVLSTMGGLGVEQNEVGEQALVLYRIDKDARLGAGGDD